MTLPGIEIAVIEERKVVGYLLAADHPEGAGKAAFFEAHGFRRADWQALAEALRGHARRHAVAEISRSPYGTKYAVDGPSGPRTVARPRFEPSGSWTPAPNSQGWSPPTQSMYE